MPERAPAWVDPVMRIGYGGRGLVYTVVGVLAFLAAWHGGQAEGTTGALSQLQNHAWGTAVLVVIAIGMFAYAAWRAIDSAMDLESYGTDARGIVARTGMLVTGLIHLSLGIYAVSLLFGGGSGQSGESGNGAEDLTAQAMQHSWGRWAVGIAGLCVIGAGIYFFIKGYKEKYRSKLRLTPMTERLNPVMRYGLYSHGAVVVLIGIFLFWAAWTYDPAKAGGLDEAFATIRAAAFGRFLLGAVALGLIGFAVFCFVNAVYRIVPRRTPGDVPTLASRAEGTMRRATARAEAALR